MNDMTKSEQAADAVYRVMRVLPPGLAVRLAKRVREEVDLEEPESDEEEGPRTELGKWLAEHGERTNVDDLTE